jgi:PKD repeat protein
LKPDIVAMGEDYESTIAPNTYQSVNGTSYASPAVAGIMAQLYQAYKEMNNGTNPPSALIKAVMCNTAEDLGNPGPDYSHGFGLVHVGRAYESLRDLQYTADSLPQLGNQSHTLEIPAGISEARIMLYWPDKEAAPGAQKALVNDLDITLTDTSGAIYQPLVLDPTPVLSRLRADAVPGTDTLNNIEQIVLKNPTAGSYQIHVNGSSMPTGKIGYYLTYYFFKDTLQLTFPLGSEAFRPQEDLILRWDAYSDTGSFDIDYTLDDGRTWTPIATGVNGALRYQTWQTPAQISGQARVRITRGPQASESRANFTIIETPKNIQFARVCQDFVSLTWDAVPGATSYDVFVLGEKYMDSVGTTTNTFFEPKIRYQNENWFSVRARGDSGILGRRAVAVMQDAGTLVNCAGVAPTAAFVVDTIQCDSQWVFLQDQSLKSPDRWQWAVSPNTGVNFIQNTSDSSTHPVISFTDTGSYQISLRTISQFGVDSTTQTVRIQSCNTAILPDFEAISINIVPNPNQGVFQLRMAGDLDERYDLELLDLKGRAVWMERLRIQGNQVVLEVDVQELPSGLYFLRVGDGKQAVVRKVVVR